MKRKDIEQKDTAVSPVIGVILMVAITVILAAVIGTSLLGLGQNLEENAQTAVDFDYNPSEDEVVVTVTGPGNADSLYLKLDNGTTYGPDTTPAIAAEAGNRTTISGVTDGTDDPTSITVIGRIDSGNTTIQTYEEF
jgi:flagellin-like protein